MKWTEMCADTYKGALDRLWVAFGDNADAIATRINTDHEFLERVAASATRRKLLEFLFIFNATAVDEFVAKEKFVEGKTTDGVSISWLGNNFKKNFLGKREKNVKAADLKVQKLLEAATDLPQEDEPGIILELAGKHRTFLAHFFQLLAYKQQSKDYSLLVGYICDENGVLWTVSGSWGDGGWGVGASSLAYPYAWFAAYRFLSR